jgi:phage gp37-like protein
MRLRTYREAVVSGLRAALPALRDVQPHGGRFNLDELKRYSVNAPAARVAFAGIKPVTLDNVGRLIGPVNMAVYLITAGRDGDAVLLDLIENAASVIRMNQWGLADISAARIETIENLYSSGTEAQGVYLAGITFDQQLAFGGNPFERDVDAAIAAAGQTDFHDGFRDYHDLSAEERKLALALGGAPIEIVPASGVE